MRPTYVAALAAALLVTGCGSEDSKATGDSRGTTKPPAPVVTPKALPTEIPTPAGEVVGVATVLDDGDGAEICLGGVMTSLPPQCGGPRLIGWDWADVTGDYEEANGVRWGEFAVTGTFDGKDLAPTDIVPLDEYEPPEEVEVPDPHFGTPCDEPAGGWVDVEPALGSEDAFEAGARVARRLDGFGELWVGYADEDSYDTRILNVSVTKDLAAAEAAIREVWGGPLCVSEAVMTGDEVRRIGRRMGDLPGVLGYGGENLPLEAFVMFDDGTLQAWVDQEYGEGVVIVSSALRLAG